jgi:peptide deformylase
MAPEPRPMAIRPVLRLGDPRLRQRAEPVPEAWFGGAELAALIVDLRDTMAARNGAGLAAPQIGVPLRVLIAALQANPRYPQAEPFEELVLINPQLEPVGSTRQRGWEGCLSVPGLRGEVERWQEIRLHWRDATGEPQQQRAQGFKARVLQHECDHLEGVLFPDRLNEPRAFGFIPELEAAGLIPAVPD